jgi:hypothetical protein
VRHHNTTAFSPSEARRLTAAAEIDAREGTYNRDVQASAEVRLLFSPAVTYGDMRLDESVRWWLWRPAMLLLVFGCTLSLTIGGRVMPRLVADAMLSFAFLPIVEIAAFAVAFRTGRSSLPFRRGVDLYFAGNGSWLLWIIAVGALSVSLPPRTFLRWADPLLLSALLPTVWCAVIDFHLSRVVLQRSLVRAAGDVVLLRLIAWPALIACYGAIAMWTQTLPTFVPWLFP